MYTLKKSLGQHFLKDKEAIEKILAALKIHEFEQLLEVGPGAGALTEHLIRIPEINFKAVELDEEKISYLKKKYPVLEDKIISADFLSIESPFSGSFHVIGNFPYNISTQILFKVVEWKEQVPVVIGMFQKEVAERAAAKSGSKTYGVLSVLIQAFYDVRYLFDVPPDSFNPPPKVMSGVIELKRKSELLSYKSEASFVRLVKTAFNQRRKTLRNAVRGIFDPEVLNDEIFNKRAEQLTIQQFAELTHLMR
ncbi:MAG: ribosomal small subunit methyltransferase [Bacteroidota bacterium]|jgi:16S rRNA (adenine1518-N6/adenine1519-N6)-dimethyltransferase